MKLNLRSLVLLCTFLITLTSLKAQTWQTVGNGYTNHQANWSPSFYGSTSDGANYYLIYRSYNNSIQTYQNTISKWNGISWSHLPMATNAYPYGIEILNGDIYVLTSAGIYKWDGIQWRNISSGIISGYIVQMKKHQNSLYLTGAITSSFGDVITKYNPSSGFSALPSLPASYLNDSLALYFHEANNEIYLTNEEFSDSTILKLSGNNWTLPFLGSQLNLINRDPDTNDRPIIFDLQGKIYLSPIRASRNKIFEANGSTLIDRGSFPDFYGSRPQIALYNQKAFFSRGSLFYAFNGNSTTRISPHPFIRQMDFHQNGLLIASGDSVFNGTTYNFIYKYTDGTSEIKGKVFLDKNGDCSFNGNDEPFTLMQVQLNGNQSSMNVSTINGDYSVDVNPGTYAVQTAGVSRVNKNLTASCNIPATISVGQGQSIIQDIGLENNVASDLGIKVTGLTGFRARHGFETHYVVHLYNAGNTTYNNASFSLTLPTTCPVLSTTPNPNSTQGNVLNYSNISLAPYEVKKYRLSLRIDTAQNTIGDSLYFISTIGSVPGDNDLADNQDSLMQNVTAAFDPNDKQASAYKILKGTKSIDYHIRFQNTGNDTAFKVTVVDTLELTLPITSIRINAASHPYQLSVVNNVLIWEFDNIMLPDSATDNPGSQGFVNYTTNIIPGINEGDVIKNKAEIYFDFQNPVKTNYTVTRVVRFLGTKALENFVSPLKVYPNPATDLIVIESTTQSGTFALFDLQGRKIQEVEIEENAKKDLDVSHLNKGIYILSNGLEIVKISIK